MKGLDEERDRAVRERALREGAGGPLGRFAIEILDRASRDFRRAPEVIAAGLRQARELGSAERRFVGDAIHDLIRARRRLALAGGDGARALFEAWLREQVDGTLPEVEAAIAAERDPVARLALAASYPDWIVRRLVDAYGLDGASRLLAAMDRRAPLTVRANRLRATRDALAERLAALGIPSRPTPLAADGLVLDTRRNVYELAPLRDGWMELQDEGSQLVAELCAPPPRGLVVDACAGAGGKTLALGALLGNRGRLLAFDVTAPKLAELRRRVRRAGLTNVSARRLDGGAIDDRELRGRADRVLVDAPCSGLGVVRRNPETRWRLEPRDLDELPVKQRALLEAYAPLCAAGGRLIYATCSLLPDENERVIGGFLEAHPEFERVPAKEILGRERALAVGDGEVLRVLPHVHDTDGFFAAVVRRRR
jgi:16S rRNA (cytosine967-C5)-methyltransferase